MEGYLCILFLCNSSCLNRRVFPAYKQMKTCDYRQEENVMELILKAKDIRVEFKGRTCLDIDELVSLTNSTQNRKAMRRKLSGFC